MDDFDSDDTAHWDAKVEAASALVLPMTLFDEEFDLHSQDST